MTIDLDHLKELCAKATPGPWHQKWTCDDAEWEERKQYAPHGRGIDWIETDHSNVGEFADNRIVIADSGVYPPYGADVEFICAARSAVPELIAEVERLRAQSVSIGCCEASWCLQEDTHDPACPALRARVQRLEAVWEAAKTAIDFWREFDDPLYEIRSPALAARLTHLALAVDVQGEISPMEHPSPAQDQVDAALRGDKK